MKSDTTRFGHHNFQLQKCFTVNKLVCGGSKHERSLSYKLTNKTKRIHCCSIGMMKWYVRSTRMFQDQLKTSAPSGHHEHGPLLQQANIDLLLCCCRIGGRKKGKD